MTTKTCFAFLAVAATILAALSLAGCQSSTPATARTTAGAAAEPARAVVVSDRRGGTTTVFLPSTNGGSPVVLATAEATNCPVCQAAAAEYFRTGVLAPTCPRTGATRTAVSVAPAVGHN